MPLFHGTRTEDERAELSRRGHARWSGKGWTYYPGRNFPYFARLKVNNKMRCVGCFATQEEATQAYLRAKSAILAGRPYREATAAT